MAVGLGLVVTLASVAGLLVIGGPQKARNVRIDQAILNTISVNSKWLACHYSIESDLPTSLDELSDWSINQASHIDPTGACSGLYVRQDRTRNVDLEYQVLAKNNYELCANFRLPSGGYAEPAYQVRDAAMPGLYRERTLAGRHCFTATLSETD